MWIVASVVLIAAIAPAGRVRIVSDPPGAEVWMGAALLGTTDEDGLDIASLAEPVVLSIRKPGFHSVERDVRPDAAGPVTVFVRLMAAEPVEPAVSGTPTTRSAPAPPPATGQSPAALAPVAKKGGAGKALPLILGGVGATAVVAGVVVATRKDPLEVDDDGDGFSEKQGDCNDLYRDLKPNGGFEFTIDFAFIGSVSCALRNPRQQTYRVKNNSCSSLNITSLVVSTNITGACTGTSTSNLGLSRTSVQPGATEVIRLGASVNAGVSFCCSRYPCISGSCGTNEQYTLATNAGTQTITNSFITVDPSGFMCPPCAGTIGYRVEGGAGASRTGPSLCSAVLTHP